MESLVLLCPKCRHRLLSCITNYGGNEVKTFAKQKGVWWGNVGDILPEAIGLPLLAVPGDEAYFFPTMGLKVAHAAETPRTREKHIFPRNERDFQRYPSSPVKICLTTVQMSLKPWGLDPPDPGWGLCSLFPYPKDSELFSPPGKRPKSTQST